MARPRAFDEAEVLDRAVDLFWARGYEATSIADLEEHLGLGRQSLYNTFGDKQQLFLRVLERYADHGNAIRKEVLLRPDAGLGAIREFFDAMVNRLTDSEHRKGCLLTNSILESPGDSPEVEGQCRLNQRRMSAAFRHALKGAVRAEELPAQFDLEAGVNLLVSQLYGLVVMSKSGGSANELRTTAEEMIRRL
jgi:TetR/AcrR family transcriptional repressor of nem operon